MLTRTSILLTPLWAAACAVTVPPAPMHRFEAGDIETTRAYYDDQLRHGDPRSGALFLNGLAEMELLAGETDVARRHFLHAGSVMGNWETSGGEALAAIVGDEGSKTWKGDPHEKVMNAFYSGVLYWLTGEHDNARACFRQGILADADSDEGGAQTDAALLYWLSGRMSLAMGRPQEASEVFDEAREARRFAILHGADGSSGNRILADPGHGNLVCLVSIGIGPAKVAAGPHGSIAVVERSYAYTDRAEIFLDGESLGETAVLLDLDYQATTRGGRTIEGIRRGKAVFKDVTAATGAVILDRALSGKNSNRGESIAIGVGLLALSFLTTARADVRHWQTLPRTVQALTAEVEPGEHELEIQFLSRSGHVVPSLTQTWLVEVSDDGEGVYHFRDLPGLDRLPERSL